jgi:1,4-alpha-glucan branching enzyme
MLYLDFDRGPGEWEPSQDGSNKNYEAIAFFKKLNTAVFERYADVLMIAEESTAWPMVTKPVYLGGLGFSFKWNMGFMNDMLKYVSTDPVFRSKIHNDLTFSMTYSFSENFILAISHDEVVHGKKSLLDKMFGDYDMKFAGFRTFLTYMTCHPGKKLLFMGSEYGQFKEWNCSSQLEWFMTGYENHANLLRFTSALNHFYLDTPELWERDFSWDGFRWVKVDDADRNTAVFLRYGADGDYVLCAFNFSAVEIKDYTVGVPDAGLYREVFTTSPTRSLPVPAKKIRSDGFDRSIKINLPPLSASIYKGEILKPVK